MSKSAVVTGAQRLVASLVDLGVEYVFTNPGTTELELVQALEANPDLTPVLVTQELVATAAADGFARFRGLGVALVHLGPGFSNGAAFVHDAKRAGTPMVVIVGQHPESHLSVDAALNTDLLAIMSPFCLQVLVADDPATIAQTTLRAAELARLHRGPVGLIAPQDIMATDVNPHEPGQDRLEPAHAMKSNQVMDPVVSQAVGDSGQMERPDSASLPGTVEPTKDELGADPILLLGSTALSGTSQILADRIAKHVGARVYAEVFPSLMERGNHLPPIPRLPYFPDQARAMIGTPSTVVLVATSEPLAYFAQDGVAPQLIPAGTRIVTLTNRYEPSEIALRRWAQRLDLNVDLDLGVEVGGLDGRLATATDAATDSAGVDRAASDHAVSDDSAAQRMTSGIAVSTGSDDQLSVEEIGRLFALYQLSGDVVVDEGRTSSARAVLCGMSAPPHWYVGHPGGAIGGGLGLALGAALATKRRVRALIADGGSLYAPQALWTIAHLGLDVGVVVVANQGYRILRMEMAARAIDPVSKSLTEFEDPRVDFVALAQAFGVAGYRATTVGELASILELGGQQHRPFLVVAEL